MKKRVWLQNIAGFSLVVCLLAGCGGEYAGMSENKTVSGSAVSGSVVSGSAVTDKAAEKKDQWCNDRNLYYYEYGGKYEEDFIIVERDKEKGSERKFKVKNGNGILYVDNDWIYYIRSIWDEEEAFDQFWRAPVEADGISCHVNWKKEELILEEDEGIDGVSKQNLWIFCNARWIAYVTSDGEYRQYDMEKKKFISQNIQKSGELACMPQGNAKGAIVDFSERSFWLDGSTGKLVRFENCRKSECVSSRFSLEEGIFMTDFYREDDDSREVVGTGVDLYHYPDDSHPQGWTESLISNEEERELLTKEGFFDHAKGEEGIDYWLNTVRIFVREQTLYQQIEFHMEEDGVIYQNVVMLSCRLGEKESLQVDRTLSKMMENPKENQKVFRKYWGQAGGSDKTLFLSRGLCVDMTEKYAFFMLSDEKTKECQLVSYEFDSGKSRVLDEEDEEWYLLYRDRSSHPAENVQAWINYMPDNGVIDG